MKNALFALSAVAAMLAVIPAKADSIANPFDVKVGGYFPYSGDYHSNGGDTMYSVGGDLAFKAAPTNPGDTLGLYADFDQNGNHSYNEVFGAGVEYKSEIRHSGTLGAHDPYYGLGVGYYWVQETVSLIFTPNTFSHYHQDEFGGKAFIGIGLTRNVFLEGSYQYLPKPVNVDREFYTSPGNAGGFGVQVGLKF